MKIFKNWFGEKAIESPKDFWEWFETKEKKFFNSIKNQRSIEQDFFNEISPKLDEIKNGIFFLAGMANDSTAELILTPDGNLNNVVLIEEMVKASPTLKNWIFTALKPELTIENVQINMGDLVFSSQNLWFKPIVEDYYPDEINIEVFHEDWSPANSKTITMGIHIFLDNYLGELNYLTQIDYLKIGEDHSEQEELVPIEKLKSYINWRQKEFIEKYEDVIYTGDDETGSF